MFEDLKAKLGKLLKVDENKILKKILSSKQLQNKIIYLNTVKQLYEQGEDSLGRSLESIGGGYSPYTIQIKNRKGQPTDHVTLKDTGDFYQSFEVINESSYIEIIASYIKNGKDINKEWGGHVIGLKKENLQIIIDEIRVEFIQEVKKVMGIV